MDTINSVLNDQNSGLLLESSLYRFLEKLDAIHDLFAERSVDTEKQRFIKELQREGYRSHTDYESYLKKLIEHCEQRKYALLNESKTFNHRKAALPSVMLAKHTVVNEVQRCQSSSLVPKEGEYKYKTLIKLIGALTLTAFAAQFTRWWCWLPLLLVTVVVGGFSFKKADNSAYEHKLELLTLLERLDAELTDLVDLSHEFDHAIEKQTDNVVSKRATERDRNELLDVYDKLIKKAIEHITAMSNAA
ncbi:hypothetical protein BDF20DRAFT_876917 [Mycotypha africana]|uniref:uncharacterized protein n=1 Tax=Mycotypha africana TaxID=64632 RepID=UPI0023007FFD|nr:uncharacterized protein BDF20DRAFT_876917 [Mycotypha africana]KAI8975116.1 hypothetical protein BDF20DRAFT_876917 [Mycotypha africana]